MKKITCPPKRDLTGLARVFGMGLLILLAWATVPPSSAPEGVQVTLTDKALSFAAPSKPASTAQATRSSTRSRQAGTETRVTS